MTDPRTTARRLVGKILDDLAPRTSPLGSSRPFAPLLSTPPEVQAEVLLELVGSPRIWGETTAGPPQPSVIRIQLEGRPFERPPTASEAAQDLQLAVSEFVHPLWRKRLPLDESRLAELVESCVRTEPYWRSEAGLVGLLERCLPNGAADERLLEALSALEESIGGKWEQHTQESRRLKRRVSALRSEPADTGLEPGEEWTDRVLADLERIEPGPRREWEKLLAHAGTASASRPSARWLDRSTELSRALTEAGDSSAIESTLARTLAGWFGEVRKPERLVQIEDAPSLTFEPPISDRNADFLRGLVWTASVLESPELTAAVARLAEVCFTKIPQYGPVNRRVGNACLWALGHGPGLEGVAWLARLRTSIRYASARRLAEQATAEAAKRAGIGADELEEIGLPDFGLGADFERREPLGDWTAVLELTPDERVRLTWHQPAEGDAPERSRKTVPAEVKESPADRLKELRGEVKVIRKLLTGQRHRFERFYLEGRSWPLGSWSERYLDHPLASHLAKRLVWRFSSEAISSLACWLGEGLVDAAGRAAEPKADLVVTLWHPLESEAEEVEAWRAFFDRQGIVQPFPQATREVYIPTAGELESVGYSNRFAGRVLKQHQLAALLEQRGWAYRLQGDWDDYTVPRRVLDRYDLLVELDLATDPSDGLTESRVFVHVSTERVWFRRPESGDPVPLAEVPTLVFSEVMRDVDLFVRVSERSASPS